MIQQEGSEVGGQLSQQFDEGAAVTKGLGIWQAANEFLTSQPAASKTDQVPGM